MKSLDKAIRMLDGMSVSEINRKLDAFEFGTGAFKTDNKTRLERLARGLYENITIDLSASTSERNQLLARLNKACKNLGLNVSF